MNRALLTVFLIMFSPFVFAFDSADEEVKMAAHKWEAAIEKRDPEKIADLYEKHAIFFPTTANCVDTHAGIVKYFSKFKHDTDLKVAFVKQNIRVSGDMAVNTGFYTFSHKEEGKTISFPGRYTFVYQKTPEGWLIVAHHSSMMPEKTKIH